MARDDTFVPSRPLIAARPIAVDNPTLSITMRPFSIRTLRVSALGLALVACKSDRVLAPTAAPPAETVFQVTQAPPPEIRFSELHYDNASTDAGEAIEISGPGGADVNGWKIYLYNGSGGATYSPHFVTLAGSIPASGPSACGNRGVISTAILGIQNGNPDGIALVNSAGTLIEFLSYGGTFVAVGGPANGVTSTSIGVAEPSTTPVGHSLQRNGDGTWNAAAANTFGACNANDQGTTQSDNVVHHIVVTPATASIIDGATQQFSAAAYNAADQPIAGVTFTWSTSNATVATVSGTGLATGENPGDAQITATSGSITGSGSLHVDAPPPAIVADPRLSEIHYDNFDADVGEAIEVEGPINTNMTGWSIVLYNGNGGAPYNTLSLSGALTGTCSATRGAVHVTLPQDGLQNGSPDGVALVNAAGALVEFLSYEGTFTAVGGPANGVTSTNIGASESSATAVGQSLQRSADGSTWSASASSFGYLNACGGPPPVTKVISFSGRSATNDPPLPVGFEAQIFATEKDGATTVPTTITWSSDTPAIASIDANGVVTSVSAGTAVLRATATDGTTGTYSLPMIVGTSSSAPYGGNTEFGDPTDANPANDFIIRRPEYTTSFNSSRGIPNWVSFKLDATNYGTEDRCNCFTFDPELQTAGFARYTTANYTGATAFHGYGIDRGHLARSADRTSGNLDNAMTYYFSNIIPQASHNNQGPWADMELYLGNLAKLQNKQVYVIAGASDSVGTVKNEGKIVIPRWTWKVALIMDRGEGLANVQSSYDVTAIAVVMPNIAGILNVDWNTYRVTIDSVEALTGYDVLSLLEDNVERAVESNDRPPVAVLAGPSNGTEGSSLAFDGSGSTDPDVGDVLTYAWTFGDGSMASGAAPSHSYAENGSYTVTLTVTDSHGVTATASRSVTVTNVAPVITSFTTSSTIVHSGANVTATVSFTDMGVQDTHSAVISWGDGQTSTVNAGSGTQASATHAYASSGFYTIGVTVADDEGSTASTTAGPIAVVNTLGASVTGSGGLDPSASTGTSKTHIHANVRYEKSGELKGDFSVNGSSLMANMTSSSFEYLVMEGSTETLRGAGTLSDGTTVQFLARIHDADANGGKDDAVRVKVWRTSDGQVLFDTAPGDPDLATPTRLIDSGNFSKR